MMVRAMQIFRKVERSLIVSIFVLMVVLFSFSVVVRELPGNLAGTFAWIPEAVRLLNLYLVFLTLGIALEKGRHVSISTLREKLSAQNTLRLRRLIDGVGVVFSCYFVVLAFRLSAFIFQTGQVSPTLGIPMSWIYAAPVAGFSLLAFRYLLSLLGVLDRYSEQP